MRPPYRPRHFVSVQYACRARERPWACVCCSGSDIKPSLAASVCDLGHPASPWFQSATGTRPHQQNDRLLRRHGAVGPIRRDRPSAPRAAPSGKRGGPVVIILSTGETDGMFAFCVLFERVFSCSLQLIRDEKQANRVMRLVLAMYARSTFVHNASTFNERMREALEMPKTAAN